jgi:eukaryotic-like serine/threonine-protein kinase
LKRLSPRTRGLAIFAISLSLGAAASVVSKKWVSVPLALVAASVLTAVAALALARGKHWMQTTRERKELLSQQLLAVHQRGKPHRLRELHNPVSLRIHPSVVSSAHDAAPKSTNRLPSYVPRDIDDELRTYLQSGGFVLLIGESTAGKSRSAYEAVRALYPDHYLIAPVDRKALRACVPIIREFQRSVVWLDDLERFLGVEGLTGALISRVLADTKRRTVVIATLRTSEYDRYSLRAESEIVGNERESWYAARDVLSAANIVEMGRLWSQTEISEAEHYSDDPRIKSALKLADQFGVAEILAAAPELMHDWNNAWRPGAHPRGAALVMAAVDCRRAGVHDPIPYSLLSRLSDAYLELRGGPLLRPENLDDAVRWATSVSNGASSLLMPTRLDDHYIAFDYLVDLPAVAGVPDFVWDALLEQSTPSEAFNIGEAAFYRFRYDKAVQAYQSAVDGLVPNSEVGLASAIGETGDPGTAISMLRSVIERWGDRPNGDDVLTVFRVRHQYAYYSACAGNLNDAVDMFQTLAEDQIRILGHFHRDTLNARHRHAFYTAESGDNAAAAELFTELLADQVDHLGPVDSDTMATRHELAYSLGRAGSALRAIEILQELLSDRRRVYGSDDPRTYQTRHLLSRFTGYSGHPAAAATMFRQIASDWARLLSPAHQHVLLARYEQLYFLAQSGDREQAAILLTNFFSDRDATLGLNGDSAGLASDFLNNIVFGWPPHSRYPRQEFLDAPTVCAALLGSNHATVTAIDTLMRQRLKN